LAVFLIGVDRDVRFFPEVFSLAFVVLRNRNEGLLLPLLLNLDDLPLWFLLDFGDALYLHLDK
jgi:hypothetical protein